MDTNEDAIIFISKYLYLKKSSSSQFCWHHQNNNGLLNQLLKALKSLKKLAIMYMY